jgi:pteridine reductase
MGAPLNDKTVLVTGGARRVGAAICRRLHAAGANMVVHCNRSQRDAQTLVHELNGLRSGSAVLVQADLLEAGAPAALVKRTVSAYGGVDVLVNNASSFYATPLGQIDAKAWDDLMGTNLRAPLFLSQAAAPELRRARGCIVNIIDIHAERPLADHMVYTVAKGGLMALTRSLALELGPDVRVNGVSPGAILWPEGPEWQNETDRQGILERSVLKRRGEPDDIAGAVEFLANAPYVTGQIIAVDGGRSIVL